ncbi:MAG: hypothetical protein V4850_35940 [Myxococcota bacterium]
MHRWVPSLMVLLVAGCAPETPAAPPAPTVVTCPCPEAAVAAPEADKVPTKIALRDVELIMPDGLLRVRNLDGVVQSLVAGRLPVIDAPDTYRIVVDQAEVAVDTQTLNEMMSGEHSKSGKKTPLQSAVFSTEGDLLVVTGKKPVPFVLKGAVSVDPKGRMTITVVELKALGVQTKGILKALDLKLEDLIDVGNERGVSIDGNVVYVDPLVNMPPPAVDAKVTGVSVERDGLVLRLGDAGTRTPETPTSETVKATADTEGAVKNFLSYTGGTVDQGNLTVRDTSITLVDVDTADPLRLDMKAFNAQIAAGYVRIGEGGSMTIFIPDADQLGTPVPPPAPDGAKRASAKSHGD